MGLDILQGEEPLGGDRLDYGPLADPVAVAHLHVVAHQGRLGLAAVAGVPQVGLAEEQVLAHVGDLGPLAHELEEPGPVRRVAVEHGPGELVVADDQLLVDPGPGVLIEDLLGPLAALVVAGGEQVDAGHLELGRGHRALVAPIAQAGQVIGADLGLLEQRRHQAVADPAMLDALAHRVDAGVIGEHGVVHHDAALAVEPGLLGQGHVGADAHGHDHQVRRDLGTVGEAHPGDPVALVRDGQYPRGAGSGPWDAQDGRGLGRHQELQSPVLQGRLEHGRRGGVELTLHQAVQDVNHGHLHALAQQTIGRLQPQQSAPDDHRVFVVPGRSQHGVHVGDVAIAQNPRQVVARDRDDEGVGARGQQQAVIGHRQPRAGTHGPFDPVDGLHRVPGVQGYAVLGIPVTAVEDDLIHRLLPGQDRREQDAVVVGVRLGTEDGDVVEVRLQLEEFLDGTHPRHAVTDQDQALFHTGDSAILEWAQQKRRSPAVHEVNRGTNAFVRMGYRTAVGPTLDWS